MKISRMKAYGSKRGAALVEYGVLVGLIAVVSIGAVSELGQKVSKNFDVAASALGGGGGFPYDRSDMNNYIVYNSSGRATWSPNGPDETSPGNGGASYDPSNPNPEGAVRRCAPKGWVWSDANRAYTVRGLFDQPPDMRTEAPTIEGPDRTDEVPVPLMTSGNSFDKYLGMNGWGDHIWEFTILIEAGSVSAPGDNCVSW